MINTESICRRIEQMREHIKRNNQVAREQAAYHKGFADKHFGLGNTERAERHLDRAAAWLGTIDDELAKYCLTKRVRGDMPRRFKPVQRNHKH